jgi:hypothetical protein
MNNHVQLTPRSIWEFGKVVEKNGKKALAIVMASEYAETTKTGLMPSGKCYEDYLLFVREKMFIELGTAVVEDEDDEVVSTLSGTDGNTSTSIGMKDNWIFPGYIAFALWGPIMPDDMDTIYKANAFMVSDSSGGKVGRRQTKSQGIIIPDTKPLRSSSFSNASVKGTNQSDYLVAASIAQQNIDSLNVKT